MSVVHCWWISVAAHGLALAAACRLLLDSLVLEHTRYCAWA